MGYEYIGGKRRCGDVDKVELSGYDDDDDADNNSGDDDENTARRVA